MRAPGFGLFVLIALPFAAASFHAAGQEPSAPEASSATLLRGVPHVLQKPDFCGEACVEMWARRLGADISQDDVFNASGLDPALGRGCYTAELVTAIRKLGFDPGPENAICSKIRADKASADLRARFSKVISDLRKGVPSILCMRCDESRGAPEHFRLVVGYDPKADAIFYMEPAEKGDAPRKMKLSTLFELWPLKYSEKEWTAVAIPLAVGARGLKSPARPNPVPVGEEKGEGDARNMSQPFTDADYAQHVRKVRARLRPEMSVVVEKPFIVAGDLKQNELERYSKGTVRWAVDKLKASYFDRDPNRILTVWLFSGPKSYNSHAKELTGETPDTPYGFYSSVCDALIMDISTGGGTLVHEIVHPFIEADFPSCPPWLNEGLGSLYEQCGERSGQISGFTNWRLAGLKKAIAANALPDFKTLASYDRNQFYGDRSGCNYAQARYLCYYLQERGLLVKFYKEFRANSAKDPSGYATLLSVLGLQEKDMPAFKKSWQDFVLKLKFNE